MWIKKKYRHDRLNMGWQANGPLCKKKKKKEKKKSFSAARSLRLTSGVPFSLGRTFSQHTTQSIELGNPDAALWGPALSLDLAVVFVE